MIELNDVFADDTHAVSLVRLPPSVPTSPARAWT